MANKLRPPTKKTLRTYGITEGWWYARLEECGYKCPVCKKEFTEDFRPVVDHYHVKGYDRMTDENKQLYNRGVCCSYCNLRRLPKGTTKPPILTPTEIAYNIHQYFLEYERRRDFGGFMRKYKDE